MIPLVTATFYRESEVRSALAAFILRAEKFSMGTECETFERRFAEKQGRRHCVLVNSGSSANLALVQALLNLERLRRGDLVGFSAVTWSTNVMPLLQLGLRVVPIDVELATLNVSSRTLRARLAPHPIRMLFLTDLLGWCDDLDRIREICDEHQILLVEDACESLGTVYRGTRLGNFGLAATFSFYVSHQLSTVEGGAVCTDDDELATMLRIVRAHGWDRNLDRPSQATLREKYRVATTFTSRYTFYDHGFNLRPTEITGFLGNVELPYLDEIVRRREENFRALAPRIYARTDRYYPLRTDHLEVFSNFAVPILCRSARLHANLVAACEGHLEVRPVVGGDMEQQPFFRRYAGSFVGRLGRSNAALVHAQGLYFGNFPEMTKADRDEILRVFASEGEPADGPLAERVRRDSRRT